MALAAWLAQQAITSAGARDADRDLVAALLKVAVQLQAMRDTLAVHGVDHNTLELDELLIGVQHAIDAVIRRGRPS